MLISFTKKTKVSSSNQASNVSKEEGGKNSDSRGDVRKRQSVNDKRPLSSHRPITAVITLWRSCQTLLHETHQSLAIIQVFRECPLQSCFSSLSLLLINECFWRLPYEHLHPVFLHAYGTPPYCWVCTFVPGALVFLPHCHVTLAWQNSRELVRETPAGWRSTVRMCYWLAALNELE